MLDTALDIAKAMLHLHIADVLHGDLKVWNCVLMRGYVATMCVAWFSLYPKPFPLAPSGPPQKRYVALSKSPLPLPACLPLSPPPTLHPSLPLRRAM